MSAIDAREEIYGAEAPPPPHKTTVQITHYIDLTTMTR